MRVPLLLAFTNVTYNVAHIVYLPGGETWMFILLP